MEKKSKLIEASAAVATTTTAPASAGVTTTTRTTTTRPSATADTAPATNNPFVLIWRAIVWVFRLIFVRIPVAIWKWLRSLDVATITNMALLVLIIIMFAMLTCHFLRARNHVNNVRITNGDYAAATDNAAAPTTAAPADAPKPMKVSVRVPAKVTFDKTTDKIIIEMPLKKTVAPAVESGIIETPAAPAATTPAPIPAPTTTTKRPLVASVETIGDEIVDVMHFGGPRLVSNSTIHGNLFVQNAHFYTLPCNITVEGDLYIRNVGLLKFCGDFNIRGNIVVSSNSSFGPIPSTARLGGQVIF